MRLALLGDCGATESAKVRTREHTLIFCWHLPEGLFFKAMES